MFRMVKKRVHVLIILVTIFLIFLQPTPTSGFIPGAWTVSLAPSELVHYEYDANEGDGLIAWVSIQRGNNVSAFFINSSQFALLQTGQEVELALALLYVSESPDTFDEMGFPIPYDDMWYFCLYNHNPIQDAEVRLVIHHDDEGPEIKSTLFNKNPPYYGDLQLELNLYDKSNYFRRIEVYIDDILVFSENNTFTFPGTIASYTINLPTYQFEDGNHSLRIEVEDYFGHITMQSQVIEISNSWLDIPANSQIAFLLSGMALFALLILIVGQRTISFTRKRVIIFSIVFALSFILGIYSSEFLEISAVLFSISFISLALMIDQSTSYLEPMIKPMIEQTVTIEDSSSEETTPNQKPLQIPDLLGRSDILDKVRSNLRNGMSIVFGIGTAIVIWFADYNTQFSLYPLQVGFLLSGLGLALIVSAGIVVSFFPLSVQVGTHHLDESLISDLEKTPFIEGLSVLIKMKLKVINSMRFCIGFGLGFFVVTNLFITFSFVIFDITHASHNTLLLTIALIPLFFVLYALVHFVTVLFGPIFLEMTIFRGCKKYIDRKFKKISERILALVEFLETSLRKNLKRNTRNGRVSAHSASEKESKINSI